MKIDNGAGTGTTPGRHSRMEAGIQKSTDGELECGGKSKALSVRLDTRFPAGMAAQGVRGGTAGFVASVGDGNKGEPSRHCLEHPCPKPFGLRENPFRTGFSRMEAGIQKSTDGKLKWNAPTNGEINRTTRESNNT